MCAYVRDLGDTKAYAHDHLGEEKQSVHDSRMKRKSSVKLTCRTMISPIVFYKMIAMVFGSNVDLTPIESEV